MTNPESSRFPELIRERREEMLAVFNNSGETNKANIKVLFVGGQLGTGLRFRCERDNFWSGPRQPADG